MLSTLRSNSARTALRASPLCRPALSHVRSQSTVSAAHQPKRAGDISDAFASLSNAAVAPLPPRFAENKRELIRGNEDAVIASWNRLLDYLKRELPVIEERGPSIIPEVSFEDVKNGSVPEGFEKEYRKRGVAVIRGVVPEQEALE